MKKRKYQIVSTILCVLVMLTTALTIPVSAANSAEMSPVFVIDTFVELPAFAAKQQRSGVQYISDPDAAADLLREGLTTRRSEITVNFQCSQSEIATNQAVSEMGFRLVDLACRHTGVPNQGDYLLWHLSQIWLEGSYYCSGGNAYIQFVFTPQYYTTAQQETLLDAAVEDLVSQLGLDENISDYEKLFNIYHYICSNVKYDYENLYNDNYSLKYSAYAALMDQTAVCQGYSLLFYRLALEAGIDNRVITGVAWDGTKNANHAWNMAELGGVYYYLDTTWDAGNLYSEYFLKAARDFYLHYPFQEYADEAFFAAYPQAQDSYAFSTEVGGIGDRVSLGHREVAVSEVKAGCVTDGLTAGICCSACGEVLQGREVVPAVGHQYVPVVTAPTCGTQGYTTHTCSVCQDNYTDRYVQSTGAHTYQDDKDELCDVCGYEREVVVETTPMYRLYNPNSGEHFYTGSIQERDVLAAAGWIYEGIAWNAPTKTGAPVYRLYNPNSGDHHYTMSAEERDMLVSVGWQYEGVCWNSASSANLPLYRLYNPNADCGSHHYTGSMEERTMLVNAGWIYEGIGWYGTLK